MGSQKKRVRLDQYRPEEKKFGMKRIEKVGGLTLFAIVCINELAEPGSHNLLHAKYK